MARTRAAPRERLLDVANRLRERKALEKAEGSGNTVRMEAFPNNNTVRSAGAQPPVEAASQACAVGSMKDQSQRNHSADTQQDRFSNITPSDCYPQDRSPLFNMLPAELRRIIYLYAFVQYESPFRSYPTDAPYYRPGCTGPKCIDIALLCTCRRVFFEARYIPLQTAVHDLWQRVPAPEQYTTNFKPAGFTKAARGLTEYHLPHMQNFHFYSDLGGFSSGVHLHISFFAHPPYQYRCKPRHVTITVPFFGFLAWQYGLEPQLYDDEETFLLAWPDTIEEICIRFESMEKFLSYGITLWKRLGRRKRLKPEAEIKVWIDISSKPLWRDQQLTS
ncbi:hypothetical protein EYZ11_008471 [Aspergillus tanneri]|uniref:Uncharacterized protein n=1 Tax=Aspergillus tanneri TaxID=1220188 RepID=A0A4S3JAC8_9EURO|nr:hypothetical protein EYZ11_008471 [Aspergillus tanneri]